MSAAGVFLRAALRGARTGLRLTGVALDRRRELGLGGAVRWVADRAGARRNGLATAAADPDPPAGAAFDVIFAIGYWDGEPKRYRVFNRAEELRNAGYRVHVMPVARLGDISRVGLRAGVLVLFRAEFDPLSEISKTLAHARAAGMRLVYDIDDLVFDPALADRIDGINELGPHQRRQFIAAMARRQRLMLECDLVTASTAPLARAAAAFGRPSAVIPNSLNRAQLALAAELAGGRSASTDGMVTIGYFSGTRTHRRDFAVCEPALLDAMERHPEARLRIVGHLDLGPHWTRFAGRVERIGLLPPDAMLRALAKIDINLAPLEPGNPFCEAKSELKFFEAAILGVPTVASASEPMSAAIENGVSGFVVHDERGWTDALHLLAGSALARAAVGTAARRRALALFGPEATVCRTLTALRLDTQAGPLRTEPRGMQVMPIAATGEPPARAVRHCR